MSYIVSLPELKGSLEHFFFGAHHVSNFARQSKARNEYFVSVGGEDITVSTHEML